MYFENLLLGTAVLALSDTHRIRRYPTVRWALVAVGMLFVIGAPVGLQLLACFG
jgi:hypothetical protein